MSTRSATHYELIGLSREASADEIKAAFRTQAQIHHPDAGGDTESFAALSAAHDVLSDPVRRSDYDATLPSAGSARFSGWSRSSTPAADAPAAEAPARRGADEDEAPRRRSVEAESGDDPSVFRQRGESRVPTVHRSNDMTDEPRDNRFGAVAGSDADSSDDSSLPQERREERTKGREIDRRDRSGARRFRFFGRDDDQPKDDAGEQSDQENEQSKDADTRRDDRKETQPDDAESAVGKAKPSRGSGRDDYDQAGDFAPSKRAVQRDEYDQAGEFAPAGPRLDRRNDDFAGEFAPSERKASRRNDDFAGEFAPSERKARRRNDDFAGEFAPPERRDRRY